MKWFAKLETYEGAQNKHEDNSSEHHDLYSLVYR